MRRALTRGPRQPLSYQGQLVGLVAVKQFRFQEAEDLIRQRLSLPPETSRFGIAFGLGQLCGVQLRSGQFAEAETTALEGIDTWEDLGMQAWTISTSIVLAEARLHVGAHPASWAREMGWDRGVHYGRIVLGQVALTQAAFSQAYATLQESLEDLEQISDDPCDVHAPAWIGMAARSLDTGPRPSNISLLHSNGQARARSSGNSWSPWRASRS